MKHQVNHANINQIFSTYFAENALWENKPDNITILIDIVALFRSKMHGAIPSVSLQPLIDILYQNPTYLKEFKRYIHELFENKGFVRIITDVGIYGTNSFWGEFKNKLYNQFLPEPSSHDSVRFILSQVFFDKSDHDWIKNIPYGEVKTLFDLISPPLINQSFDKKSQIAQLILGIDILTLRICGKVLEKEIIRIVPEFEDIDSPFLALHNELEDIRAFIVDKKEFLDPEALDYKQTQVILNQCKAYVDKAFKNSKKHGISLGVNKDLTRIKQQLLRIEQIIPILTTRTGDYQKNTIQLFLSLIFYNAQHKNLIQFLSDSGQLFAYEITSQTAKTGLNYISSDHREFYKMWRNSLGGGFIVGLMCISKVLLAQIETSAFGHAFLYSVNYALGFVILYLLGFALATKQPAMTASTLVTYLEYGIKNDLNDYDRYKKFAKFFSQLFRTQFISFLGNVVMAFPIALCGAWLIQYFSDYNISASKSAHLFHDLNPFTSLAILHAGIAGIYLFVSGLIAGNVSNRNKFYTIDTRIADLPILKRTFGPEKAQAWAAWYNHKWPGIMSNMWFGIFMGSTASIGAFLGLNLDIRHITFGAGNFALAIFGNHMEVSMYQIYMSLLGIFLIGVMNFMVSFGLSLATAFKAKNIPIREIKPMLYAIFKYFSMYPAAFFFPSQEEDGEVNPTKEIKEKTAEKNT